jgi:hypothetical protein
LKTRATSSRLFLPLNCVKVPTLLTRSRPEHVRRRIVAADRPRLGREVEINVREVAAVDADEAVEAEEPGELRSQRIDFGDPEQ